MYWLLRSPCQWLVVAATKVVWPWGRWLQMTVILVPRLKSSLVWVAPTTGATRGVSAFAEGRNQWWWFVSHFVLPRDENWSKFAWHFWSVTSQHCTKSTQILQRERDKHLERRKSLSRILFLKLSGWEELVYQPDLPQINHVRKDGWSEKPNLKSELGLKGRWAIHPNTTRRFRPRTYT